MAFSRSLEAIPDGVRIVVVGAGELFSLLALALGVERNARSASGQPLVIDDMRLGCVPELLDQRHGFINAEPRCFFEEFGSFPRGIGRVYLPAVFKEPGVGVDRGGLRNCCAGWFASGMLRKFIFGWYDHRCSERGAE